MTYRFSVMSNVKSLPKHVDWLAGVFKWNSRLDIRIRRWWYRECLTQVKITNRTKAGITQRGTDESTTVDCAKMPIQNYGRNWWGENKNKNNWSLNVCLSSRRAPSGWMARRNARVVTDSPPPTGVSGSSAPCPNGFRTPSRTYIRCSLSEESLSWVCPVFLLHSLMFYPRAYIFWMGQLTSCRSLSLLFFLFPYLCVYIVLLYTLCRCWRSLKRKGRCFLAWLSNPAEANQRASTQTFNPNPGLARQRWCQLWSELRELCPAFFFHRSLSITSHQLLLRI